MSSYIPNRVFRALAIALLAVAAAVSFVTPAKTATTWNPGDIFVGVGNQFLGGATDSGRYLVLDANGNSKGADLLDGVGLAGDFTTGCAVDPTVTNGNLWTTGWWSSRLTQFSGVDPHTVLNHLDLSSLTGLFNLNGLGLPDPTLGLVCSDPTDPDNAVDSSETCGGAVQSIAFAKDGTFYVGSTYGSGRIYHYKQDGTKLGQFTVNSTGNRGVDWVDLAIDQQTIYYTALDDYAVTPLVIRSYNTVTNHQNADIPITDGTTHLPVAGSFLRGFRILPPGDGTGGYLVATSNGIFQIAPDGTIIRNFIGANFVSMFGGDITSFLAITLTPDGRSFWTASFPDVDATFDADGNETDTITRPSQLFEFHIATGAIEAGPINLGTSPAAANGTGGGAPRVVDGLCVKLEYTAGTTTVDCKADPFNGLCKPLPICTGADSDASNPECQIPGAPVITALVDNLRGATYASPNSSTVIRNKESDVVNMTVQATSGIANPALTYTITPLPKGVTLSGTAATQTGTNAALTGTLPFDASDLIDDHLQVRVTVTNANGKSTSTVFEWYVDDLNLPPVITAPAAVSLQHGIPGSITITATDNDVNDSVSFSAQPAVAGMSLGAVTQSSLTRTVQLSGAPQLAAGVQCPSGTCVGTGSGVLQTVVFADDHVHAVPLPTQSALVTITLLNLAPALTQPVDQTLKPGQQASIAMSATDANGDALTYSLGAAPSGVLISAGGLITGSVASAGTYPVTVVVADGHGGTDTKTFNLKVSANSAPVCSAATASPNSLWPPDHRFVTIAIKGVTDPDGDPTTIKINRILQDEQTIPAGHYDGDGCNGHHHSSGDSYDRWDDYGSGNTSIDGIISGTNMSVAQVRAERAGDGNGRVYDIRFTATDPSGNSCMGAVTVNVPHDQYGSTPVDSLVRYDSAVAGGAPLQGPGFNLAPVYANPGDQTTNVGKVVTLSTTATDRNLDTLTYAASGLPAGLAIKSTTGAISGTPATAGTFTVTLTASDPYGGVSSVSFKWTIVANRPPVAVSDTVTDQKGVGITVNVLANDSDPDGDSLKIVSISGTFSGTATINSTGTITYRPTSSFIGVAQFAYTISDGRGGTATATVRVNVVNHQQGDNCDHERGRNGHYPGDGCDHDRACGSSSHH